MKRGAVLALAAVCVAAWAAPAAAADFTYGGFMRYRAVWGDPGTAGALWSAFDDPVVAAEEDTFNTFVYRVRQFFNLKVNDHVSTSVRFEWNSEFGDEQQIAGGAGDLQFGGTPATANSEVQFRIKNAFLRFDVPGAPITIRVGQQDFSTPKALISGEDGTGVQVAVKALGGEHTLFWQRNVRGLNNQTGADDADWFGAAPAFNVGGIKLSPHVSSFRSGGGLTGPAAASGGQRRRTAALRDSEIYFFGVDSSGKLGPVGFTADLIFQQGRAGLGGASPTSRQSLFSYIADASVSLAAGPGTVTVKGIYSPGDDNPGNADVDSWVNVLQTDIAFSTFFHDGSSIGTFSGSEPPGPIVPGSTGIFELSGQGGVAAVGLEFAFSPVKGLTITPNAYYLRAAEAVNMTDTGGAPDKEYGWEFGAQANWKIWDAVTMLFQFDYLIPGDAFKTANGDTQEAWRAVVGPSISW